MDAQIRLGCLQLAADLAKPTGDYSAAHVVNIATVLYNFTQTPPQGETQADKADKPVRGKKATKVDDLLS